VGYFPGRPVRGFNSAYSFGLLDRQGAYRRGGNGHGEDGGGSDGFQLLRWVCSQIDFSSLHLRVPEPQRDLSQVFRGLQCVHRAGVPEALASCDQEPDVVVPNLRRLCEITTGATDEMRVLLSEMRPQVLEKSSLGALISQLTRAVKQRLKAEFSVAVDDRHSLELPFDVRLVFYRVAQESLNNVIKTRPRYRG
jgi:hypothetical protein